MGFLNASSSFTRFRIVDPVPKELWPEIPQKLVQFAFVDIDDVAEERSFGWACFDDMFDTQWHTAPPEKGAYLTFTLRLETRRIPSAVLRKHLALAIRTEEERVKEQGKKFVARERKKELRDQVRLRLMSRFLPIPAEFQVIWSTEASIIYLGSTQNSVIDLFTDQFTRSFDLHIEPLTPYTLATSIFADDEAALAALDRLEVTRFI